MTARFVLDWYEDYELESLLKHWCPCCSRLLTYKYEEDGTAMYVYCSQKCGFEIFCYLVDYARGITKLQPRRIFFGGNSVMHAGDGIWYYKLEGGSSSFEHRAETHIDVVEVSNKLQKMALLT